VTATRTRRPTVPTSTRASLGALIEASMLRARGGDSARERDGRRAARTGLRPGSYGKDPADLVAIDDLIRRRLVIFRSVRAGLEQPATKN